MGFLAAIATCMTKLLYLSLREYSDKGAGTIVRVKGSGYVLQDSLFYINSEAVPRKSK